MNYCENKYNNRENRVMKKSDLDSFITYYTKNVKNSYTLKKNKNKINDDDITIPDTNNYNLLLEYNFNIKQLKGFLANYNLKTTGNKEEIFARIYTYLYLSRFIINLQKTFRGKLQRKYNSMHGPAWKQRSICNNPADFVSLEPIEDIILHDFISFKCLDGFVYGCSLKSLYNHSKVSKTKGVVLNPYNRNEIPKTTLNNMKSIIKIAKNIYDIKVDISLEDDNKDLTASLSTTEQLEHRCINLFQAIDELGNYTNYSWFLSLSRGECIKFTRELIDIWGYRSQITIETRRQICPPIGNPFYDINTVQLQNSNTTDINIKLQIMNCMERMVYNGINNSSKNLGALYILSALTLVNQEAALSLPWLYESVNYS